MHINSARLIFLVVALSLFLPLAAEEQGDTLRHLELSEVTVTPTLKQAGLLRQQPYSVTQLSATDLMQNHVESLKAMGTLLPNFFMPDYGSRQTSALYIRGVGSRINAPAVGLYVDNIPYVDKSAFDFDFYDIERVDVLRGPQGTLYGRNTMGGLIRVFTRNPFYYQGTDLKLGYATGDYHRTASLTHYHRVSPKLAFAGGGHYEGSSGFFVNETTRHKADRSESGGGRLRGIYKPAERLSIDFSVSYDYSHERAYPYFYTGPQSSYPDGIATICANRQSSYRRNLLNAGVSLNYRLPQDMEFVSTTGYQYLNDRMFMDQDFLPLDLYTLEQKQRIHTLSQEFLLRGGQRPASRWHWLTGASLMYQSLNTQAPVVFYEDGLHSLEKNINDMLPHVPMLMGMGFGDMAVNFRGKSLPMSGDYSTPTLNAALFHESSVNLTDALALTLGLRLDYERLQMTYNAPATVLYGFSMPNTRPNMSVNLQNLQSELSYLGRMHNQFLRVLPKLAFNYELRSHGHLYATASMGQRSGGYNLQMFSDLLRSSLRVDMMQGVKEGMGSYMDQLVQSTPGMPSVIPDPQNPGSMISLPDYVRRIMDEQMPQLQKPGVEQVVYKPEYSLNYEIGAHLNLWKNRLLLDASAFIVDTRNQQIARFAPTGLGRMMVNAGRSRSAGTEVALNLRPDSHWQLAVQYGYTHATFVRYDAGDAQNYTGCYVPFAPQHTLHGTAGYAWLLRRSERVRSIALGADYSGAGRIYWTEDNSISQRYYSLLGAYLRLELDRASLQFWGRNLTGTHYNTFYFENAGRGFEQHGRPLQVGADLRLRF